MKDKSTKTGDVVDKPRNTEMGFRNPYPESFGYLRIGTPVNVDISRPDTYGAALDMERLNGANLLRIDSGPTIEKEIQGSGFDEKAQNAWGTSGSVSGGYKGSFLDITAEFHWTVQQNISTSSGSQYVLARSKQKSGITLVDHPTQTQIYQCGTDGFREAIDNIVCAVSDDPFDPGKVLKAINEFYRVYGTGFISKLELGALGVFEGSAQYSSKSDAERLDLGGSLSVSGFVGGASAAADFSKQKIAQNAKGTFMGHSFGVPVGSASERWASSYVDAFAGSQLLKLGQLEAWSAAFNAQIPVPKPPQFKEKPPHPEPIPTIPKGRVKDIEGAIRKMQLDAFAEDFMAHHGRQPSPDEYSAYLDQLQLVSQVNSGQINLVNIPPIDPQVHLRGNRAHPRYFQNPASIKDQNAVGNQMELGDYTVTGFDYRPWSDVLPFLKNIEEAITGTQVSLGLALVWLSIRRMMGQYLMYCSRYELPPSPEGIEFLAPEGTGVAANAYILSLQEMSDRIVHELQDPESDWWDPSSVLQKMESEFQTVLKNNGFDFFPYYDLIKNNYDWLKRVPFGAIAVVPYRDRWYYQPYGYGLPKAINTSPDSPSIGPLLVKNDGLRFYPIIAKDKGDNPYFAWIGITVQDELSGASLTNYRRGLGPYHNFKFNVGSGMAVWREDGPGFVGTAGQIKYNSDLVHIIPEKPYDGHSWRLKKAASGNSPDCVIVSEPGYEIKHMCLSGVGLDFSFSDVPKGVVQEHKEIVLVPIDYDIIRVAFPDNTPIKSGGVPMWFEPMTEMLLEKLNKLGISS